MQNRNNTIIFLNLHLYIYEIKIIHIIMDLLSYINGIIILYFIMLLEGAIRILKRLYLL